MKRKFLSLLLVLALCLSSVLPALALPADVPEDAWFAAAVSYVLDAGIMEETEDGFDPYGIVDMMTLLRSLYVLAVSDGNFEASIAESEFTTDELVALVSRLELAATFSLLLDPLNIIYTPAAIDGFSDADSVPEEYLPEVRAVVGAGILKGRADGTLDLGTLVTRAELAQIHYNLSFLTNHNTSGAVAVVDKYGNLTLNLYVQNLYNAGFKLGDMLTITIGELKLDAPFCTSYSDVDTGNPVVRAAAGLGTNRVIIALNMGNFATTYEISEGDAVSLEVKEAGAYFNEWELRQLKRTNNRDDYSSDEVFANFRNVAMGNIAAGKLYRSSSPVNNELGRASYADALCAGAKIATVINLANSEEELKAYFELEGFASDYYKALYEAGGVICLNMGVDFKADDFKAKLKLGLEFMLANKGPYLIHCTEGKDRAGFVAALLEALMGADADAIAADYMATYVNYYKVDPASEQYQRIADSNILESLRYIAGLDKGAALAGVDLVKAAEAYLAAIGLDAGQIAGLKSALA